MKSKPKDCGGLCNHGIQLISRTGFKICVFFSFAFFFLLTVPNRLDIFLYKPTIRCNIQVKSCFHLNIYKEELRHVLSRVLTWTFSSEFTESIFFSPNLENSERNYKFVMHSSYLFHFSCWEYENLAHVFF